MFSLESCFPFHRMLYFFIFYFLNPHKLTGKERDGFSWAPLWDLRLTLRQQDSPSPPSQTFSFRTGCVGKSNGCVCVEEFKDRGETGALTGPPTATTTHHPLPDKHTGGYSCYMNVWQIKKENNWKKKKKKKTSCDPKLTSTLKRKRYNLKDTIGQYVWLCVKCDIDLYGEYSTLNLSHDICL